MRTFLMQMFYYVVLTECIQASVPGGLKWVRVNVPQYRFPGDTAHLLCDYDLGNDTLYAVKWYKEHEEFYRFVPKARPQATSYKLEGVFVDMGLSDRKKVVLRPVNLKTSGLFKCEVSAEAPSFSSAQSEARMEVVSSDQNNQQLATVNPDGSHSVQQLGQGPYIQVIRPVQNNTVMDQERHIIQFMQPTITNQNNVLEDLLREAREMRKTIETLSNEVTALRQQFTKNNDSIC